MKTKQERVTKQLVTERKWKHTTNSALEAALEADGAETLLVVAMAPIAEEDGGRGGGS